MKYRRSYGRNSLASVNKATNPRPHTPALILCRGCGDVRPEASATVCPFAACPKCGSNHWEIVPARSPLACNE